MMPQSRPIKCNLQAEKMCAPRCRARHGQGGCTDPREDACLGRCRERERQNCQTVRQRDRKKFVTIKRAAKHSEIYVFMPLSAADPKVFPEERKIFMIANALLLYSCVVRDEKLPKPMSTMRT